jgi:hypothetical protein
MPLTEQIAILTRHLNEWVLIIDSDECEPERAWKDSEVAIHELQMEGWQVVQGPAVIHSPIEELDSSELSSDQLKRIIH